MSTSPLLTYAINTTPSVLTAGFTDAAITVLATNLSTGAVTIEGIEIGILTGTSDAALTNEPEQVAMQAPAGWADRTLQTRSGQYAFVFVPPGSVPNASVTVQPGSSVYFILFNIQLNKLPGTTVITVTEGSGGSPAQAMDVSIYPAGWDTVAFSALPPDLPIGGGNITLHWNGPQGAAYQIQYIDPMNQQLVNIPSPGAPPLASNGMYPGIGEPALPIVATTVFTLQVTETISGDNYSEQLQVTVTVAEVPPLPTIPSFTGSVVYNGNTPTLELVWRTEGAYFVTGDWTDEPLATNMLTPLVIQSPFNKSYQLTAKNGVGEVVQSSPIQVGWNIVDTIDMGMGQMAIATTLDGAYVIITNNLQTVSVISTADRTIIEAAIPVGNFAGKAVDTALGFFLVPNSWDSTISVIDKSNFTDNRTITVTALAYPQGGRIAVTPDGNFALMPIKFSYQPDSFVSFVRLDDFTVEPTTVNVGSSPLAVAVTPDGNYGLVVNMKSNNVSVIAIHELAVTQTISVGNNPCAVAVTPDGTYALVANSSDNTVSVITTNDFTVTKTIPVGNYPSAITITPDGKSALIVNIDMADSTLSVINIGDLSVHDTIITGSIVDVAVTPDGRFAFTANMYGKEVSVLAITTSS